MPLPSQARSFGKDCYRLYACQGAEDIGCEGGIRGAYAVDEGGALNRF